MSDDTDRMVTEAILPDELAVGLDKFREEYRPRLSQAEAAQMILRLWLIDNGYIVAEPGLSAPWQKLAPDD